MTTKILVRVCMGVSDVIQKRKSPEVLRVLKEEPTHVRGIQEKTGGSASTVQSRIREMMNENLIRERRQESFPYRKVIELTDKGRAIAKILDNFDSFERKRRIETIAFEEEKDRMRWPLLILHQYGELGNTMLQKLVFLAKREFGMKIPYNFTPYKHGPFSKELARDLGKLVTLRLVDPLETQNKLSPKGEEITRELYEKMNSGTRQAIKNLKKYRRMDLRSLLNYVYKQYPEDSWSSEPNYT